MALNPRQKKFAEEYLKCFNASQAAREAGYSEKTAASIGYELLRKPEIKAYIHARVSAQEEAVIASADEIMAFMSSVLRGEVKDQFGLDVSVADKLKAGNDLLKRHDAGKQKTESGNSGEVREALAIAYGNYFHNIGYAFNDVAVKALDHAYTHYDLAGGRGSLKSSFISETVPLLVMANSEKMVHAVVFRKVANTLRDSVYAQYIWALDTLGVADYWEAKKTPMELIFKPTGQKIMFRGADDPMKIKSIKVPKGYIAITHFEEKDQFAGRPEIRNILQSTQRGGSLFWNFESYNPPRSRDNWANKDSQEEREDRLTHKSTYLQVQKREWLGEQFIAEAEHLRQADPDSYAHEYGGEAKGTGGNVFKKLQLRSITDQEVKSFDKIYQGTDWGWFPDPYAFVRLHYDRARETIYLIDEIYGNHISNEESARMIRERGYNDTYITCDNAEPKSIADYRASGLPGKEAVKGPGSVEYGMKWLQLRTIVIDRKRTPNAAREFEQYEYERNKDGEIMSGYPDANNHTIDAVRYALERVWRKYGSKA